MIYIDLPFSVMLRWSIRFALLRLTCRDQQNEVTKEGSSHTVDRETQPHNHHEPNIRDATRCHRTQSYRPVALLGYLDFSDAWCMALLRHSHVRERCVCR